jgi:cytoskeleton protein RodZ
VTETAITIAQELTRQRELKGLTMAQLSAKTKIAERFIEAMEKGDFKFLPSVYVRAFLRTLSAGLGLDPEAMVRQLVALDGQVVSAEKPAEAPSAESLGDAPQPLSTMEVHEVPANYSARKKETAGVSENIPRDQRLLLISTIAVVSVILIAVYFLFLRPSDDTPLLDTGTVVEKIEPGVPADTTNLIPLNETVTVEQNPNDELKLSIKTSERAWVRIVYKDSLVDEGMFAPGDGRTWTSYSRFYLKIGNAGGVRLYLNSQDLGNAGDSGKVANLMIDKQGIVKIADVDFPAVMKKPGNP